MLLGFFIACAVVSFVLSALFDHLRPAGDSAGDWWASACFVFAGAAGLEWLS
jgi:hypothetical protein